MDAQTFSQHYKETYSVVYSGLCRKVAPHLAEDLTQQTFMKAWKARNQYTPGTNFKAWIQRIAFNTFINSYRKRKREWDVLESHFSKGDSLDTMARPETNPEVLVGSKEEALYVHQFVNKYVQDDFLSVVQKVALEERSYKEVAEMLQIPVGTVMSRLHRGRKNMEKHKGKLEKLVA
jgi:RNA polymerase sigma-70 factor, ECF subfamily